MSKKAISGALVATFLLAMGVSAAEHGGPGMHGMGNPDRMVEMMSRHLDLDEVQSESIRNILSAARPEMEELRASMRENRRAIADLDPNDPDYGARLGNLADESGRLASRATEMHGRLRVEINAELTEEQRAELREKSTRMRERFREHRRHRDDDLDLR